MDIPVLRRSPFSPHTLPQEFRVQQQLVWLPSIWDLSKQTELENAKVISDQLHAQSELSAGELAAASQQAASLEEKLAAAATEYATMSERAHATSEQLTAREQMLMEAKTKQMELMEAVDAAEEQVRAAECT